MLTVRIMDCPARRPTFSRPFSQTAAVKTDNSAKLLSNEESPNVAEWITVCPIVSFDAARTSGTDSANHNVARKEQCFTQQRFNQMTFYS